MPTDLNSPEPLSEMEVIRLSSDEAIQRLKLLSSSVAGTSATDALRDGSGDALAEIGLILKTLFQKGRDLTFVVTKGVILIDRNGQKAIIGGEARQYYVQINEGRETIFSM